MSAVYVHWYHYCAYVLLIISKRIRVHNTDRFRLLSKIYTI